MLLTLTTTHSPATDLGFLLHKHPNHVQSFELSFGQAQVFYSEADKDRCTAALLLDIDPIGLVRGRRGHSGESGLLAEYVNDRPYVASSFLSVAISNVYGSALSGRSQERPELVNQKIPLIAKISVLPCKGGEGLLKRLFEPLGYQVSAKRHPLDEQFPEWGDSAYFTVTLQATCRLQDLLAHIYVLVPVLDNEKHYWIGEEEVEKLLHHGSDWLAHHPEKALIAKRYLKHQMRLTRQALARLVDEEEPDFEANEARRNEQETTLEEKISLNEQRLGTVVAALKSCQAKRVLDLGCGEGKLLQALMNDKGFEEIVGVDVSHRALEIAQRRLHLDRLPEAQKARLKLIQGSLTYRDKRLYGYDAAAVIEVIEHFDLARLSAFERVLFEWTRPTTVIITTPNVEYNIKFENLPADKLRHSDHRFEWTRIEFQNWAKDIGERFGYSVRFLPIGEEDGIVGAPTQMGILTLNPDL
ncbi:MAG: 3' terminal RNA ribose 2'-O-methyltransferase Hen1 [Candidatus Parabeggiatoa sp. nov. 3]|nr:MAG: 3' terminal RNA ribose 2'-O-methyltransferase Hen1 [Gammaproteobacteria bacterium]RKZ66972.1 MAG: 3' terminal RNA ribose 2'-O-methyltransferase Hen1 [Gammaproteobacteria bacterium]RKZ86817.1 MAG: 3' terminal RNA ribose 2'-O-methyltransferase Hen1 [Gammaproteobacteria bacterium]HEW97813.1 3' terminal RNA ribose 2'-O-methyltransferase Hen1 [Beggiatoa sp.]